MKTTSVAKRKTRQTARERENMLLLPWRATSRRRASAGPRAELIPLGCLVIMEKNIGCRDLRNMSSNHVELIETIAEQLAVGGCAKKDALGLRKQLLGEHPVGGIA